MGISGISSLKKKGWGTRLGKLTQSKKYDVRNIWQVLQGTRCTGLHFDSSGLIASQEDFSKIVPLLKQKCTSAKRDVQASIKGLSTALNQITADKPGTPTAIKRVEPSPSFSTTYRTRLQRIFDFIQRKQPTIETPKAPVHLTTTASTQSVALPVEAAAPQQPAPTELVHPKSLPGAMELNVLKGYFSDTIRNEQVLKTLCESLPTDVQLEATAGCSFQTIATDDTALQRFLQTVMNYNLVLAFSGNFQASGATTADKARSIRELLDTHKDTIQHLNCNGLGLTCLPPEIAQLPNLQSLNLANNRLAQIPRSFLSGDTQTGPLTTTLKSLDLSGNPLQELPEDLPFLRELTTLTLKALSLTDDKIPNNFSELTKLGSLDLSSNNLTRIPEVLTRIGIAKDRSKVLHTPTVSNLKELLLTNNPRLTLETSWGNLAKTVTKLDVSGSQAIKTLPETLSQLQKLTHFYARNCKLDNHTTLPWKAPSTYWRTTYHNSLTTLDLSGNSLTTLPQGLENLTLLQELRLQSAGIKTIDIEQWKRITKAIQKLQLIDFSGNQFETLPATFGTNLINLQSLILSSNKFKMFDEQIALPPNLTSLDLSYNLLATIPATFQMHGSLETLSLSHNELTKLPETSIRPVFSALHTLDLSSNRFEQFPDQLIGNEIPLESLDISHNRITQIPTEIDAFSGLVSFDASHNRIKECPEGLWLLPQLKEVTLAHNQLDSLLIPKPEEPEGTQGHVVMNLAKIDVSENKLTKIFIEGDLTYLTHLDLSHNQLSTLPQDLSERCQSVLQLNISDNQFQLLPQAVASLRFLSELSASSNKISLIPTEISALTQLRKLDLADNSFGQLPPEIGRLPALESLDLGGNTKLDELPSTIMALPRIQRIKVTGTKIPQLPWELSQLPTLRLIECDKSERPIGLPSTVTFSTPKKEPEAPQRPLPQPSASPAPSIPVAPFLNEAFSLMSVKDQKEKLLLVFLSKTNSQNIDSVVKYAFSLCQDLPAEVQESILPKETREAADKAFSDEKVRMDHLQALVEQKLQKMIENTQDEAIIAECVKFLKAAYQYSLVRAVSEYDAAKPLEAQFKELIDNWDEKTKNITTLDLSRRKGVFCIPHELGYLKNLTELRAQNLRIGSLPPTIRNLTSLTVLNLDQNALEELPDEIGDLSSLQELDIGHNQLQLLPGSISKLTLLRKLDAAHNALNQVPETINRLTALQKLKLSNNRIRALPSIIALQALQTLQLQYNFLTAPPNLSSLTALVECNLSFNNIQHATQLPSSLQRLRISHCQIQALPDELGDLTQLRELDISGNALCSFPSTFNKLSSLEYLYASDNKLSYLPDSIWSLKDLKILDVSGKGNSIPSILLPPPPTLEKVEPPTLFTTQLQREIMELPARPSVEAGHPLSSEKGSFPITTGTTLLSGSIPQAKRDALYRYLGPLFPFKGKIPTYQDLRSIVTTLSENVLPPDLRPSADSIAAIPQSVEALTEFLKLVNDYQLVILLQEHFIPPAKDFQGIREDLHQWIQDSANTNTVIHITCENKGLMFLPPEIDQFSRLESLNLAGNKLTTFPTNIGNLKNLRHLDVSRNLISSLPPEIGQLTNLQTFRLQSQNTMQEGGIASWFWGIVTRTSGETVERRNLRILPKELSQLENLTELDISDNQVERLPEGFSSLKQLRRLYLQKNSLAALAALKGLPGLRELDVSENTDISLQGVETLTQLTQLNVSKCNASFEGITLPDSLLVLILQGSSYTEIPKPICDHPHLLRLDISSNALKALPEKVPPALKLLDARGNKGVQIPEAFTEAIKQGSIDLLIDE